MNRKKVISFLMAFIMIFSLLFNFGGNGSLKAFAKDGENTISVEQKESSKTTTPSAIEVDEKTDSSKENPNDKVQEGSIQNPKESENGQQGLDAKIEDNLLDNKSAIEESKKDYSKLIDASIKKAVNAVENQGFNGDWIVLGLSKAEANDKIEKDYISKIEGYLTDKNAKTIFRHSPTEYERITLGVLAAGGNPKNIAGMNLIERICNANLEKQGINALVFGLMAIDAGRYKEVPDAQWNREKLINAILADKCAKGGWSCGGGNIGDPDMTGMAMTALAPYYNNDQRVKSAIDEAIKYLLSIQTSDGGFVSYGSKVPSSESCVQVIMGLCSNKIDPTGDKFTRGGKNVVDVLLDFQNEDGGFAHIKGEYGATNKMATEQALYALDQYKYFLDKKGSIYDFGDRSNDKEIKFVNVESVQIEKTEIILEKGKTEELKVIVNPEIATNQNLIWKSSNNDIAYVNQDGIVEAIGSGQVTITATTQDGGKTASCKVIVGENIPADNISLNKNELNLNLGQSEKLIVKILPENTIHKDVKWASSAPQIASVDETGNVTALAEGKAEITATTVDGGKSVICTVTIKKESGVKVLLRVEGNKETFVPKQEVIIDKDKLNYYTEKKPKDLNVAFNALVIGLLNNNVNVNDSKEFGLGSDFYIASIKGDMERREGFGNSGWKYKVNGICPGFGCANVKVKDGDYIEFYYLNDYEKDKFGKISVDKKQVNVGENTVLKLEGQGEVFGQNDTFAPISNATILVNGKEYKQDGQIVKTDDKGKVAIKFDSPGIYEITAKHTNKNTEGMEYSDLIKPESITVRIVNTSIENVTGQKEFTKGREAKITVKATNTSDKVQSAALIVGLFDSKGALVNYVASSQDIKVKDNTELTGRIKLPNAEGYTIRAFVWDGLKTMNPISDVIEIPVK